MTVDRQMAEIETRAIVARSGEPPSMLGRRTWTWRLATCRGVRLLLIGGLIWAGWSAASGWTELLSKWEPATTAEASGVAVSRPAEGIAAWLEDGDWTFGDPARPVTLARAPEAEARTWLERPFGPYPDTRSDGPDERMLIDLGRCLSRNRYRQGAQTFYKIDHAGLRGMVLTQVRGDDERLVVARAAIRSAANGDRVLLEYPATDAGCGETGPAGRAATIGLLPRSGKARLVAARRDARGRIVGAIAEVEAVMPEIVRLWQREGWHVARPDGPAQAGLLSVTRGDQAVGVLVIEATSEGGRSIVIAARDPGATGPSAAGGEP
jgi:hypothetical protein